MTFTKKEMVELRYVLAAFKAGLPPHEPGEWLIEVLPHRVTIEDDRPSAIASVRVGFGYLIAEARCLRCGQHYKADGRFWVRSEDDHTDAVSQAKESIERAALRCGPCWGGVPRPPAERQYATLDGIAAMREP